MPKKKNDDDEEFSFGDVDMSSFGTTKDDRAPPAPPPPPPISLPPSTPLARANAQRTCAYLPRGPLLQL